METELLEAALPYFSSLGVAFLNTGLCQTLNSPHTRMPISKLLGILPQTGDILSYESPALN